VKALPAAPAYVELDRTWRDGDTVTVTLPKALRLEPTPDDPRRVAGGGGPRRPGPPAAADRRRAAGHGLGQARTGSSGRVPHRRRARGTRGPAGPVLSAAPARVHGGLGLFRPGP